MRVLIVDGDLVQAKTIEGWLNEVNITCFTAELGEEALAAMVGQRFDCIVLNSTLPDMTGEQFLANLEEPNTPIVYLSNVPMRMAARVRVLHKVDALVIKPFVKNEVIDKVSSMVDPYDQVPDETTLYYYTISVNVVTHNVACGGKPVPFNVHESLILELLVRNADEVVTDDEVRSFCFGDVGQMPTDQEIAAMVKHMSDTLYKMSGHRYLQTVKNYGHRLWHPPWMRTMPVSTSAVGSGQ